MAPTAKKVLIADDEPDVHAFVQAVLEPDGHQVLTAMDGQAALKTAYAERPDLIILDVEMPKKSGFDVFEELRRHEATKSIPIIMLTGINQRPGPGPKFSAKDMTLYYESSPDAFIEKPVDPATLRDTVNRLLNRP